MTCQLFEIKMRKHSWRKMYLNMSAILSQSRCVNFTDYNTYDVWLFYKVVFFLAIFSLQFFVRVFYIWNSSHSKNVLEKRKRWYKWCWFVSVRIQTQSVLDISFDGKLICSWSFVCYISYKAYIFFVGCQADWKCRGSTYWYFNLLNIRNI